MNSLLRRFGAGLLALLLVFSLAFGSLPVVSNAASTYNTGTRHDYNAELSDQALDYYTGNYTWENLSSLDGGNENCLDMDNPMFEALHDLMADTMTQSVSYDSLPDHWKYTDTAAGASGKVVAFYTDSNTTIGSINREHVWPKSHASFKEKNGGCDLHHLRPTFNNVNSSRGSLIMGNVRDTSGYSTYSYDGKKVLYKDSGTCEVNDNIKGDVARILLYVWCRWEEPNLFKDTSNPQVGPSDDKNDGGKVIESLNTLLEWCEIDPVDTWEMSRNDRVQDIQGNRNVFIDYPEFAWLIFGQDVPDDYDTPSDNGGTAVNPGCAHQWNDATCTLPKTCSLCGKTQGEANGHTDTADDGICDKCGEVVGCIHQWKTEYDSKNHYQKCTLCGDTKNVVTHTLVNNQCECGYVYTPTTGNTYVKVTTAPADWSGEYLIVYEDGSFAFDGSLTKLDNNRNTISVVINDGKITLDDEYSDCYFTITSKSSGYTIQSSSGYYIGQTSNANGLAANTATSYINEISFNGDGSFVAKSGGAFLRFNTASDQMRFRYYKSGTYTLQEPIALYKREVHSHSYVSVVTPPTCTEAGEMTYTCTAPGCGHSYTEEVPATGHQNTEIRDAKEATTEEEGYTGDTWCTDCNTKIKDGEVIEKKEPTVANATLNVYRANIRLQELMKMGFYFTMNTEEEVLETGAIIWTAGEYANETVFDINHTTGKKYPASQKTDEYGNVFYTVETDGIPAQEIDTQLYIAPYVKTVNGYAYGTIKSNSILNVAKYQYQNEGQDVKDMIADVLNYATAARNYFVIKGELEAPAEAFNAILSTEDKALAWSDELRADRKSVVETDSAYKPTAYNIYVYIQEALKVEFVFNDASVVGVKYWKGTDYTENDVHDDSTKTGEATIKKQGTYVIGAIEGINAYEMYEDYYVRGYNVAGELSKTYTTSIAAYLTYMIDNPNEPTTEENQALVELCKAMLIYGKNALENDSVNKG